MLMTVWEDFATKLSGAIAKNHVEKSPLIVMLTLAKIKEATDKYPLSIQNIKAGSKMFINEDVSAIRDFSKRLDLSQPLFTGVSSFEGGVSQSQFSGYSQGSAFNRFLHNARMVKLEEINSLRHDCFCLTVGTVVEILIDSPWSYDSCSFCTTTFDPKNFGSNCRTCHNVVSETVPRFKLVLKLEHNGEQATFHLWDAITIKILGRTAEECRQELIKNGEDVKVFPECFDDLLGKTWAVRFKFRAHMRQASIIDVRDDTETIQAIQTNVDVQLDDASSLKEKIVSEDSLSQQYMSTPSLSESAEYDPSYSGFITPAKRMPDSQDGEAVASQDNTSFQLSTNKHIKSEK